MLIKAKIIKTGSKVRGMYYKNWIPWSTILAGADPDLAA